MADSQPLLGIDIGGTKLAVGVVRAGEVSSFITEPTRRDEGPGPVLRRLWDMCRRALDADDGTDGGVPAAGISCGGPLDAARGVLLNPPHLHGWIDVPIVELVGQNLDVPAFLENDATAAALGEYCYGAGVGTATMLYLTISTGVGGGAVIDGRLHRGAAGNGGEFGHLVVERGGRPCWCGRAGCLETYASGSSIAERAVEVLARDDRGSSLREVDVVTAEAVASAARSGDGIASEIWDESVAYLAEGLADLINVFEPDVVVLGGGVTRAGDFLLEPVRKLSLASAVAPAAAAADVRLSKLSDHVGVVGAAAVAGERLAAAAAAKEGHRGS